MSRLSKSQYLPPAFLVLGLLGQGCRSALYQLATDSRNLLTDHPLRWVLLGLTLLAAGAALMLTRKTQVQIPQGVYPAVGSGFLGAALVCQSFFMEPMEGLSLFLLTRGLSWAGALCAFCLAWCHSQKKKPFFGLYALLCAFFCIFQILCYQLWSDLPQLQNYAFSLGAVLCAILFLYGQAAQALDMKHTQFQGAIGLFGIFCCCTAMARCEFPILCAGTALFFITELTGLTARKEA